jgi:hypothetical protein
MLLETSGAINSAVPITSAANIPGTTNPSKSIIQTDFQLDQSVALLWTNQNVANPMALHFFDSTS